MWQWGSLLQISSPGKSQERIKIKKRSAWSGQPRITRGHKFERGDQTPQRNAGV